MAPWKKSRAWQPTGSVVICVHDEADGSDTIYFDDRPG